MALSTAAIYQDVYNYLSTDGEMDSEGLNKLLDEWNPAPAGKFSGNLALINLCANLRADMASAGNKAAGKGNLEKAMLAVIKNAPDRPSLNGAFMNSGMQCVCDGFRVIRLREPINLPVPEQENTMDIAGLYERKGRAYFPLALPTLGELKTHIKVKTAENKALYGKNYKSAGGVKWDFGEDKPVVNAAFLVDILTAFPEATAEYSDEITPILFEDVLGDALLLPIRRSA